jgi:cell division septation protein DedD
VAQAGTEAAEPAVVEQTAEVVTAPAIVALTGTVDTETAVIEETAQPAAAAEVVALNTPATAAETAPDIGSELETATQTPVRPEAKTGKWVINLSSYTRKPTAERMLAMFQRKGVVDAEVFTTTINDKPMHRIRVTGFQSARSAKAEISTLEQQLDLEGAWVSKR